MREEPSMTSRMRGERGVAMVTAMLVMTFYLFLQADALLRTTLKLTMHL